MTAHNLTFWDLAISPFTAAAISPQLYILSLSLIHISADRTEACTTTSSAARPPPPTC